MYAVEGCGKTTWASKFPDPVFIDTEEGSLQLDVKRFPKPETWRDILDMVDAVADGEVECQTLVVDTADRAEELLIRDMLNESNKKSIEDYGYGKGYVMVAERFTKDLLYRLDKVIARGINVVLTAHAAMRKVESPDDPPYDHWEMSLSKKLAPKIKEWSDLLLFANYRITIIDENGKSKARGRAKRVMYANHHPTYDAKNRFGLPDEMDLAFEPIAHIFTAERVVEKTVLDINNPQQGIVEDNMEEDIFTVFRRHLEEAGLNERGLLQWMVRTKRGVFKSIDDMSIPYVKNLDEHIELLKEQIEGGKE